jgi:hypothetical protein
MRHSPDRQREAEALYAFLQADPAQRTALAPAVTERTGADRLKQIVDATEERVGGINAVSDSSSGLVISGPRGSVLAWTRLGSDGSLTDLLIARGSDGYGPVLAPWRRWGNKAIWCALIGFWIVPCWDAANVTGWLGSVLVVLAGYVLFEGFYVPATEPWWIRRPIESGLLVTLCSAYRLPRLPAGQSFLALAAGAVLLGASTGVLVRSRRHRWGTTVSVPLQFPLRGSWYVGQGGGRWLNHHLDIPEQRGALDLLQVGAFGLYRGDPMSPDSYLAYGAKVYAPCDGKVIAAVDGLEEQTPGTIRYGPPYGNHVFIDTGNEVVKLAHIKPGTVAVTEGQQVRAGDLLGEVGNTGNSSDPHLHIHAERDGQGLDLRFSDVRGRLYRGRIVRI